MKFLEFGNHGVVRAPGSHFSKVSIFSVTVVLNPLLSDWFVKVKKQGRIALFEHPKM